MSALIALDHVDTWVFDLDNTLYPAESEVMAQVSERMTLFVMQLLSLDRADAYALQKKYLYEYGTTLTGLIANHELDTDAFLDFTHDVDHDLIDHDPLLVDHIQKLEGRKIVFTNGSQDHAEKVLARLGLTGAFDDLYDIRSGAFVPKPNMESFERFNRRFGINPVSSVMFEDSARNLKTASELGYTTVLIRAAMHIDGGVTAGPDDNPDYVHYIADCLRTFLGGYHAQRPTPD